MVQQQAVVTTAHPLRRDGRGNGAPAIRNSYDPAGRLTKVEQGALAAWQSDGVAPASWPGFSVFKVIDTQYDALDRKTREVVSGTGVTAAVTEYGYDLAGRLKCTALRMNPDAWATPLPPEQKKCVPGPAHAANGTDRISKSVYDPAGRLTESWDGVGTPLERREAAYTYNANGQKLSLTDARGYKAEMRYDGFGRQQSWIFPSKTTPGVADQADYEQYLYDSAGNRTKLRKRDGSELTFQYDALNRVFAKIVPERSGLTPAQTRDVYYDYDLRGLQTKARFDSLAGDGVTTQYDGFGRVTSSTLLMAGVSRAIGHAYDSDGNRLRITHPDTSFFTYDYDGLGRFIRVRENGADPLVVSAYDNAGRRSGLTNGGTASSYGYDPVGRLQSLTHNLAGPSADQVIGLGYNPASQIVQRTGTNIDYAWTGAFATNRPYAANGLDQYTSAGPATFGYDANGNLTSVINPPTSTAYVYDVENRLVSASGASSATLVYDPLGRLWEVTSPATGTTRFLYDDDALIAEYTAGGYMISRYIHGSDKGVDDPLIWYDNPNSGWRRALVADQQGSIIAIADMYGNPIAINAYDEYGIPKPDQYGTPGAGNKGRFQYTGQAWLAELGMYYYKARFYSPTLGRFMQVDPIGYEDQVNLYAYVSNDPVNGSDPNGTCGNRYEDGSCQVKVDPKTGAAGVAAGKAMEDRLNNYDRAVNALDPKSVIPVANDAGRTIGTMTGRELRRTWNHQKFSITSRRFKNGGLGRTVPGRTRINPQAVSGYAAGAAIRGGTPEMGRDTLIFHELGHALDPGREIAVRNPARPGQPNPAAENAANAQGRAISNSVGGSFMCTLPGPYGC